MISYGIYVTVIVLLLFGVSIFVHELGHFITARLFGMIVEVFSLGFGPSIWKKKHRGTLYKIGIFPIGGYVALPQMDPTEALPTVKAKQSDVTAATSANEPTTPPPKSLPSVAPWKKIVVAAAGAAGNMVLAVIIAWIVYWGGKPSTPGERAAIIGFVDTNSAAYTNGLRMGDDILAVNGVKVQNWNDVIQENSRFQAVTFTLRTPQGTNMITVPTEKNALGFRMVDGLREVMLCKVMAVEAESGAAQAGVHSEDVIVRFNDVTVLSVEHLVALVSARPEMPTPLAVERAGQILVLTVSPHLDPALGRARIGIRFDPMAVDYDKVVHIPPSVQLKGHATMILRVVRSLLTPNEARHTSQGLGGPPMIIYMIQDAVRKGIMIALWFMCFLNVNLAILNLLPIPVLDGGHILFSLWELVTRRPIHPKLIVWIHQFFFALFIGAIILLSGRDFQRLYKLRQLSKNVSSQMAVTNALTNAVTNAASAPDNNKQEESIMSASKKLVRIELSQPVTVAIAPPEVQGWGPYQFPGLSRLPDGRIQVSFHVEADSATAYGLPPARAVSADEGKTWSLLPREAITAGTLAVWDTSVLLPNGDWLKTKTLRSRKASELRLPEKPFAQYISYGLNNAVYRVEDLPAECAAGWMLQRLPAGHTQWQEERATVRLPGEVRIVVDGVMWFPWLSSQMVVAPDGTLWSVNYTLRRVVDGRFQEKCPVTVLRSIDAGRRWEIWSEILYAGDATADPKADKREGFTEPYICFMPDGSVLVLMRTTDGEPSSPMYWSRSIDSGKTWSRPAVFDDLGVWPKMLTLKNGVTLAAYGRPGLYVRATSDPAGLQWEKRVTVVEPGKIGADTCSYAALLPLNDHTALLAYSNFNLHNADGKRCKGIQVREVTVTKVAGQ